MCLVVDNSIAQCEFLKSLLGEQGYKVFIAQDAARAIEMYINYKPDLVLMNINLPSTSGFEIVKKLKALQDNSIAPLIYITEDNTEHTYIESVKAGADDLLIRPFSKEIFKAKIKSIQRLSELYKQARNSKEKKQQYVSSKEQDLEKKSAWEWQLKLCSERLSTVNPIPMIMEQINLIEDATTQWQSFYTILTELFVNALDHGVLGLSSELKNSADGFNNYFQEREKRLNKLDYGFIEISLKYFNLAKGGEVVIIIKDSGSGFDVPAVFSQLNNTQDRTFAYSGRGLHLVNKLCSSLVFKDGGSLVEAVFVWS